MGGAGAYEARCALVSVHYKEVLADAVVPEKLSAIRRCPLFGVSAIRRVLKYGIYGKRSWYIAHCPLYGRCPLFGVSAKRGSTVLANDANALRARNNEVKASQT